MSFWTVRLSSFHTPLRGFRITLLEQSVDRFEETFRTLARSIEEYLSSR